MGVEISPQYAPVPLPSVVLIGNLSALPTTAIYEGAPPANAVYVLEYIDAAGNVLYQEQYSSLSGVLYALTEDAWEENL